MKKVPRRLLSFYQHRNKKKMEAKERTSRRTKHNKHMREIMAISDPMFYGELIAPTRRIEMINAVYCKKNYDTPPTVIKIEKDFGIEDKNGVDYFLQVASQIVDCSAKSLTFDLFNCSRMWPSAVTLMCSLKHWVEMKAKQGYNPSLKSTMSTYDHVNGYLDKCGFYDYVGRSKDKSSVVFSEAEMVKIEQETDRMRIKERRDQLRYLITKFSSISPDDKEKFIDHVLVEVTQNVVEHGLGFNKTLGWWAIAQLHRTHGFISLCIADNGIGFRNSLLSGSQHKYISDKYPSIIDDEGKAIKLAFDESVSGAIHAPIKVKRIFRDKYERGSHRGNGLKRIRDACKDIGISLAVLSHSGYLFIDAKGRYEKLGHSGKRVFAGTLYHFIIPAIGVNNDQAN